MRFTCCLLLTVVGLAALCQGLLASPPVQPSRQPAGGDLTSPLPPNAEPGPEGPGAAAGPCKTPAQWEGRFSEWDHANSTNNRYTISFDGIKRRKWVEEEQKSMRPGRRLFKFLILFDEQVEYKIDLSYNKCTRVPLGPWRNFSIPPMAIMEDHYQVGGPKGNLDVTEWSDRQPARSKETWIGGFTDVGCWPVFEIFTYTVSNTTLGYTTRFFDLTPGIKDMSVFDVPALCKAAEETEAEASPAPDAETDGPGFWERLVPDWLRDLLAGPRQKFEEGEAADPERSPGGPGEAPAPGGEADRDGPPPPISPELVGMPPNWPLSMNRPPFEVPKFKGNKRQP